MNQPIPRSFFKDGQRAKIASVYLNSTGTVSIEKDGEVLLKTASENIQLLDCTELLYTDNDLELLDRTIDQAMDGDTITSPSQKQYAVLARIGGIVFLKPKSGGGLAVWKTMYELNEWTIVQPNTEEIMTDETAKALREEWHRKEVHTPKNKESYLFFRVWDNKVEEATWQKDDVDLHRYLAKNIFPATLEGRRDCEEYGKKYAPAFLHQFKE